MPRAAKVALTALAVIVVAAVLTLRGPSNAERQTPDASATSEESADPVARLQQKLDNGDVKLTFDRERGYLGSVLENLDIPASSQTLVFSKSSAQMGGISPDKPRALYFNDAAYVGWVDGGGLELASVDPKGGPFLYTLSQNEDPRPKFERHTTNCIGCHDASEDIARVIPRLLKLSVLPDRNGSAIQAAALVTTDSSPFNERWGGWYVTGTHGRQLHMGNKTFGAPASELRSIPDYIAKADLSVGANVTDLKQYFDTTRYLTPHSDIVALMILGHQTHVQNLMSVAVYKLAAAVEADPNGATPDVVKALGEPLVRAMLFSGEVALTAPIEGTSGFTAEFQKRGRRDSRGRSLRDLDLGRRLLRYPLSYMIYTASFDGMPAPLTNYVYRRLDEILSGQDKTAPYSHLSATDRQQISEILRETKPDFVAVSSTASPR
jgi:hypothetical protein